MRAKRDTSAYRRGTEQVMGQSREINYAYRKCFQDGVAPSTIARSCERAKK
jgi:hypothetical protein